MCDFANGLTEPTQQVGSHDVRLVVRGHVSVPPENDRLVPATSVAHRTVIALFEPVGGYGRGVELVLGSPATYKSGKGGRGSEMSDAARRDRTWHVRVRRSVWMLREDAPARAPDRFAPSDIIPLRTTAVAASPQVAAADSKSQSTDGR